MKKILASAIVQQLEFDSETERADYMERIAGEAAHRNQEAPTALQWYSKDGVHRLTVVKPYNSNPIPDFLKGWCRHDLW